MILHGNQRGGARDLALHLLKDENEHVDVHELRGFVSDNLMSALNETYALSKATKAKQFLYSLSLNPPPQENCSTEHFLEAVEYIEHKLGLEGQPRAIVFHEKQGCRHAHAVWSRIDTAEMKAIPLPYTKLKLKEVSQELYLKHGWQMPRGFMSSEERDFTNFTMQQWQQAKRSGKDARAVKMVLQECWSASDTQGAFQQALKERGYALALGDRRGFVALDHLCNPFSISKKWIGKTAKEVRTKLSDQGSLPSVDQAKAQIAQTMQARLCALKTQQTIAIDKRLSELEAKRQHLVDQQRRDRKALAQAHASRQTAETHQRQARFNKGLRGLIDHFSGKRRRIRQQNELEALKAFQRDRLERDALIFSHLEQRRRLQAIIERLKHFEKTKAKAIHQDVQQYRDVKNRVRDVVDFRAPKHSI